MGFTGSLPKEVTQRCDGGDLQEPGCHRKNTRRPEHR
ncbi:rCG38840 [Rattus norvegicus]|uniref:RCG38840 n=1 Tax=Rattus norvegicus TaxID=10116 RepID=A6K9R5_RAT|nr:rCG38840 [Rattus norvegicus]